MGKRSKQEVITPVNILKQVLEMDRYVARIDEHRMDKEGLYTYICDLLSDETIEKLNSFNETDTNKTIISSVLKSARLLPLLYARPLSARLMRINADTSVTRSIDEYIQHSRSVHTWNRYTPWLVSIIVILLCLLIYVLSHQGYLD